MSVRIKKFKVDILLLHANFGHVDATIAKLPIRSEDLLDVSASKRSDKTLHPFPRHPVSRIEPRFLIAGELFLLMTHHHCLIGFIRTRFQLIFRFDPRLA
jgi:hypothetical protein